MATMFLFGLHVGVVAPAVPEGDCILRVSLMATHTPEQVDVALGKMEQVGRALHVV